MLVLKDNGGGLDLAAGSYVATCVKVFEMGQVTETYNGEPETKTKVGIMFELCDPESDTFETFKTDNGVAITRTYEYNASGLSKKSTIRKHLEAWRGRAFTEQELAGFTLDKLLGQPALVVINERGYIASVAKPMKGQKAKEILTPISYLSLDPKEFNQAEYEELPEFFKNKISTSPEWADCISGAVASTAKGPAGKPQPDDDIPF